jgi:hypothetical protein
MIPCLFIRLVQSFLAGPNAIDIRPGLREKLRGKSKAFGGK